MNKQRKFKLISLATVASIGTIAACAIPAIATTTKSQDMTIYNKKEVKLNTEESPTNSLPTFSSAKTEWNINTDRIFREHKNYNDVHDVEVNTNDLDTIEFIDSAIKNNIFDFAPIDDQELADKISTSKRAVKIDHDYTVNYLEGSIIIPQIKVTYTDISVEYIIQGPITITGFKQGDASQISSHVDEATGKAKIQEFMYTHLSKYSLDYYNNIEKVNQELANLPVEDLGIFTNLSTSTGMASSQKPYSLQIEEPTTTWSATNEISKTYRVTASTTLYREIDGFGNLGKPDKKSVTYDFETQEYVPTEATDIINNNIINNIVKDVTDHQTPGMTQAEFDNLVKEALAQTIAENIYNTITPINRNSDNTVEALKTSLMSQFNANNPVTSASVNDDDQAPWKVVDINLDLTTLNDLLPATSKINSEGSSLKIEWTQSSLASANSTSATTTWVATILALILLLMLIALILALFKNNENKEESWLENAADQNLVL